jgi:hypothetical protein
MQTIPPPNTFVYPPNVRNNRSTQNRLAGRFGGDAQEADSKGICLPGWGLGRLRRFKGAGGFLGQLGGHLPSRLRHVIAILERPSMFGK